MTDEGGSAAVEFVATSAPQRTVAASVSCEGIGLHTGARCRASVLPAPADHGVRFLVATCEIRAAPEAVRGTRRSTTVGCERAEVQTVEHLMAALCGLGIDNAMVRVEGPELPILDGSALPWVQALLDAGLSDLDAPARRVRVKRPIAVCDGGACLAAVPADGLSLTCVTAYEHPLLGTEVTTACVTDESFRRDIAPARTYGFAEEIPALLTAGLASGGTLDNALVVHQDRFSSDLRVPHECNRHKMLDVLGDLYLLGWRLEADVVAVRPGHAVNAAFVRLIGQELADRRQA